MWFKNVDELARLLVVHLKLVKPMQLKRCSALLGRGTRAPDDLLGVLEKEGCLTPYQLERLRVGQKDRLLVGRYKLLERAASDSYTDVYRACSLRDERLTALKLLNPRWWKDENAVTRFHLRAELAAELRHWNVASIYSVGCHENEYFVAMEFAQHGSFRDILSSGTRLSPAQATRAALDISEGLHYAKSRGIIHGDLRLSNVLCNRYGVAKLVNFGLAGNEAALNGRLNGRIRERTPAYLSLEEGSGVAPNDPRSDIYFLGAMYYELLCGSPAFPRLRPDQKTVDFQNFTDYRPIASAAPELPSVVTSVVDRALQTDAHRRYQSLDEIMDDLRIAFTEVSPPEDSYPSFQPEDSVQSAGYVPSIICIENRPERQRILQEYFSRHGFRALVLADLQRGLSRLTTSPPDCILLMGEAIGENLVEGFSKAIQLGKSASVVIAAVLAPEQISLQNELPQSCRSCVMIHPIPLPRIRQEIKSALDSRRPCHSDAQTVRADT